MEIQDILSTADLFCGLADSKIARITPLCKEVLYKKREVIFEEGSSDDELYILISGRVSIDLQLNEGIFVRKVYEVVSGETFGELALLGHKRSASVMAQEDSRLLALSSIKLKNLMDDEHYIGLKIYENLSSILADKLVFSNITYRSNMSKRLDVVVPSELVSKKHSSSDNRDNVLQQIVALQLELNDPEEATRTMNNIQDQQERTKLLITIAESLMENGQKNAAKELLAQAEHTL